jgi:hypothetical protein
MESADGFGVSCRRWMPFAWRAQSEAARTPERAAWLNQVNEKRLHTLLERETRERPSADIASLEGLLIEVLHCVKQAPASRTVLLAAHGVEWVETAARVRVAAGDQGSVTMCLDPELPYEVEFFADIRTIEQDARGRRIRADFVLRSEQAIDLYERLVFIYYRRAQRDNKSC